jgi:hypothetical protein
MFCLNLHNSPSSSSKFQELQQPTIFPFNRLGSGISSHSAIYEERRSESLPKTSKECDGELNKEAHKKAPVGIVMRLEGQRRYVSFFLSLVRSNLAHQFSQCVVHRSLFSLTVALTWLDPLVVISFLTALFTPSLPHS